jgi:2-polyprenyl-3-methyl-5-hydroxy-6-metoxy-1,4-benzoquinol methylase
MFAASTDRAWEQIGKTDPYFGVLVERKYRSSALTAESRDDFFRSGEEHVERMMDRIGRYFDHSCRFQRALDFGCGVGRLVIPLARWTEEAVGIDISESMLCEAKENCRRHHQTNVTLLKCDDRLSSLNGEFDLIHSHIVLQHIPARRGYRIVANLLTHLQAGGVGVIHVTYGKDCLRRKWITWIRKYVPGAVHVVNVIKRRPFFAPAMQMNDYDLNRLLRVLQANHVQDIHAEFTDHGGHIGLILYFQRPRHR